MDVFEQSGNSISLQAKKDILLTQVEQYSFGSSLTVDGDNQLKLNAGNDIVLQHDESGSMMSIGEETKAEMNAGHDITFNKGDITSYDGGSLKIDAGNDITFTEANIEAWRKGELQIKAGNDIKVNGEGLQE